jgi:uncharacterized SAM-binding protein YcdF (DUF218 family)
MEPEQRMLNTSASRRRGCRGLIGFVLIGLIPLAIYLILWGMGAVLIVGDSLQKSDVVVLLGGGDRQRMEEAVAIYKEKQAGMVVLTETGESDPETGILYSQLQKEEMITLGVPDGGIEFTEQHGNSTYEEAYAVRKLLTQSARLESAIVVTDPYHTLRTRLIFRDVFRETDIRLSVRPVRSHWYRSTTWWQSREGWQVTLSEYAKVFAFFMGIRKD